MVGRPLADGPDEVLGQRVVRSSGSCSRWDSPFQARLTRCAATSSLPGLRTSSHHCPVSATIPTSDWLNGAQRDVVAPRGKLPTEDVLHSAGDVAEKVGEGATTDDDYILDLWGPR